MSWQHSLLRTSHQRLTSLLAPARMMSTLKDYEFETLSVTKPKDKVLSVEINRPKKRNAMSRQFFQDMTDCFARAAVDGSVRAIVLSGAGKIFTAGLDLMDCAPMLMPAMSADPDAPDLDVARRAVQIRRIVTQFQEAFNVIEKCPQPVIAAVHSACVGGGVDMICTCDIRLCTDDAWIQIKEVDVGLAADIGTLQRMPKIVGNSSLLRELAFTARKMHAEEACKAGLFSSSYADKETMLKAAVDMAATIATKSPIAVYGTKANLNYARDHSANENLEYITTWNAAMLQSEDLLKTAAAMMTKEEAEFEDLPLSKL